MPGKLKLGTDNLKSQFPKIAVQADGWDPSEVFKSGRDYCTWKCKRGHKWIAQINSRTNNDSGCPICAKAPQLVLRGVNDLKTKYPDIAAEADGWDPSIVIAGSHEKFWWKCDKNHVWQATVVNRIHGGEEGSNCPYCAGLRPIRGENDLKTMYPDIAAEANGWDPTDFLPQSNQNKKWRCRHGHTWKATIGNRTRRGDRCPYCAGHTLLIGFNDLQSKHPELTVEAEGWSPTRVKFNCTKSRKLWKCKDCGHKWKAFPYSRTKRGSGCHKCGNLGGFEVDDPAWMYLMERIGPPEEQQIGITNDLDERVDTHKKENRDKKKKWKLIDHTTKHYIGQDVLDTETLIRRWLKKEGLLVPNKKENWYTSSLKVNTLAEIQKKCGIKKPLL